jgi:hypothetical protein
MATTERDNDGLEDRQRIIHVLRLQIVILELLKGDSLCRPAPIGSS